MGKNTILIVLGSVLFAFGSVPISTE